MWAGDDLEFSKTKARLFHLGYLLLLDALDEKDVRFGTKAARLLAAAQAAGLKTSVDVVSEDSNRFGRIVLPVLKYVDYCILNEIEAGKTTGFKIRQDNGALDTVSLRHAAGALPKPSRARRWDAACCASGERRFDRSRPGGLHLHLC